MGAADRVQVDGVAGRETFAEVRNSTMGDRSPDHARTAARFRHDEGSTGRSARMRPQRPQSWAAPSSRFEIFTALGGATPIPMRSAAPGPPAGRLTEPDPEAGFVRVVPVPGSMEHTGRTPEGGE
jgi:hypothetical protein